jgi:SAM-dependent methyltransferase
MNFEELQERKRERLFGNGEGPGRDLRGVEFGPLSRPLALKRHTQVYYIDHCTTEELRAKYAGDVHAHVDKIVDVDIVSHGEPLAELIGDKTPLDYIVASHVIEHVPDLAGWLLDMHASLKEGGTLYLVVPDKRFTFDLHRRTASFEEVQSAHQEKRTRPGLRLVLDHFANVVSTDTWALWEDYSKAEAAPYAHGPEFLNLAYDHYLEGRYIDIHCWVFTPWSFMDLMGKITEKYDLGFRLTHFLTTQSHDLEFYVALERSTTKEDWDLQAARACSGALWPRNYREASYVSVDGPVLMAK